MEILVDGTSKSFKTTTSQSDPTVLMTVEGYATYINTPNRNNRYYTKDFWVAVLDKSDVVQEKLATKTLFGELKHNVDPDKLVSYVDHDNVSHVIRSYKIDTTGVWVVIDILNTDSGRVLYTLLDYGSQLGLSTRAFGEEEENSKGYFEPIVDSYMFVTWDFVSFPAFMKARVGKPGLNDSYSLDKPQILKLRSLASNLTPKCVKMLCDHLEIDVKQIQEPDNTKARLDEAINRILELENSISGVGSNVTNINDEYFVRRTSNTLNDSVYIRKTKESKSSDVILDSILNKISTKSVLSDSVAIAGALEHQIVKDKFSIYESKIQSLQDSCSFLENYKKETEIKLSSLNDEVIDRDLLLEQLQSELELNISEVKSLNDTLDGYTSVVDDSLSDLESLNDELETLREETESLNDELTRSKTLNDELRVKYKEQLSIARRLQDEVSTLSSSIATTKKSIMGLNSEKESLESEVEELKAELKSAKKHINDPAYKLVSDNTSISTVSKATKTRPLFESLSVGKSLYDDCDSGVFNLVKKKNI